MVDLSSSLCKRLTYLISSVGLLRQVGLNGSQNRRCRRRSAAQGAAGRRRLGARRGGRGRGLRSGSGGAAGESGDFFVMRRFCRDEW